MMMKIYFMTKMFNKKIINDNRYYEIDNEWMPSVTSIIKIINQEGINKWKNSIGIENANKISTNAANKGTMIHYMCERYLKNKFSINDNEDSPQETSQRVMSVSEDNPSPQDGPSLKDGPIKVLIASEDINTEKTLNNYFNISFIPCLNRITNIKAIEKVLYSKKYKYAGTVDCIAEFDNVLSIIDFKTSSKYKLKKYISSYFIQTSAYAIAYNEMYNIKIENLVIIIGIDTNLNNEVMPYQIYIENINNKSNYKLNIEYKSWSDTFLDICNNFNNESKKIINKNYESKNN